ncbi:hypothetical protein [Nocardia sp. CC227C]|uniref:hypothetical protein n=1 Tax=Nocardia sp. CC227C TaxID=3044562 RepID=UPI00278C194C|nr:hypothetical protein [Nocardia sp. CC227C]
MGMEHGSFRDGDPRSTPPTVPHGRTAPTAGRRADRSEFLAATRAARRPVVYGRSSPA